MEMQVETYDMLETMENTTFNVDDQSNTLIDELGLNGQKEIRNEAGGRQAYNVLTEQQRFVCSHLFPTYTSIEQYRSGPIPYRVLKEAKTAKDYFKFLFILHETPAMVKDPVLVGTNQEYYYWHSGINKYNGLSLIARWGEALDTWENLYAKARKIALSNIYDGLKAFKSDIERSLALIESGVFPTNKSFNLASLAELMPYKYDEQ